MANNHKVLVTGGDGVLGKELCKLLISNKFCVMSVDKSHSTNCIKDTRKGDAVDIDLVNTNTGDWYKMEEFMPDVVIHLASLISPKDSNEDPITYYSNNLKSTINIVQYMIKVNCKNIVFASSAATYASTINYHESAISHKSIYGDTKLISEKILWDCFEAYDINVINLRMFNIAGEDPGHRRIHLIPIVIDKVLEGKDITIYSDKYGPHCVRDFVHIHDVCRAYIKATMYMLGIHDTTDGPTYFPDGSSNTRIAMEHPKIPYFRSYDVGTFKGVDVLQVVRKIIGHHNYFATRDTCVTNHAMDKHKVELSDNIEIYAREPIFAGRRKCDPLSLIAHIGGRGQTIEDDLGWYPKQTVDDCIYRTYRFMLKARKK